jgi:LacI family transcriptional regulator
MKKVTLEDIAKSLGVSKTLVSLIINNKAREHGISPDTVERVQKRVKLMNYMPNQAARGLRTGKSNLIGLIVADISNPFYAKISRAIEDLAWKNDYHIMVCSSDEDPEKELQLIRILKEKQQVEGLIVSPTQANNEVFRDLKKENFPFVLIDRYYPKFDTNLVVVDNLRSSTEAVKHLIYTGSKRIGMISLSPSHISSLSERVEGYKNALRDAGIKFDPALLEEVPFHDIRQSVREVMKKWLNASSPVEAVFVANNHLAVACMEAVRDLGKNIPNDVRLVSYDDVDLFRFSNPPVTAVSQPIEEIGTKSVELLLDILSNKIDRNSTRQVILPAHTIVRASTTK